MAGGYVYIVTNRINGTLYVGVTSDLVRRVYEHREGFVEGFTKRYGLARLVWFEQHDDIRTAIQRERTMKHCPPRGKLAWSMPRIQTGPISTRNCCKDVDARDKRGHDEE